MNNNQLFKALKQLNFIYVDNYELLKRIFNIVNENSNTIIEQDIRSYYFDIKNFDHWIAYERCVNFKFETRDVELICNICVYNGNLYDGEPEDIRFKLEVKLPLEFLNHIKENIECELKEYYHLQYKELLRKIENDWVCDQIKKFFEMN